MRRRTRRVARRIAVLSTAVVVAGCSSFGPNTQSETRLQYNEVVKTTTEQQLLWSAPQSSAHREELRVASARYSAGLRIPSAECRAQAL
jgi:hypothetical protein